MWIQLEETKYNRLLKDREVLNYLTSLFPLEQRLIIYKWRDNEATPNEIRKLFGLNEVI